MSYADRAEYDFVFKTRNKGIITVEYFRISIVNHKPTQIKIDCNGTIEVDLSTTPKRQTVVVRDGQQVSVIVYDPKYLAKTLNYYMRHYGLDQDYIFRAKELEEKQKNIF